MGKAALDRYFKIKEKIPSHVFLLAVSKGHSLEFLEQCLSLKDFPREWGENYFDELQAKASKIKEVNWHFLGALQSRKILEICKLASCIHSVSRLKELKLFRGAQSLPKFYLQVNISHESQKNGASVEELEQLLMELKTSNLEENFLGLMGMAAPIDVVGEMEVARQYSELRKIRDTYCSGKKLNMGMSGDYNIAIAEGSDLIRVGTAIFGERL